MQNNPPLLLLAILALFGLALVACQAGGGPEITIENAWGRPSPKVATAGAFYMTLKNNGGEADSWYPPVPIHAGWSNCTNCTIWARA